MEMRPAGAAQSTPAKVSNVIATPAASSWRTPHRGLARRRVAVRRRERGNCGGLLTPVLPLLCYWRLLRRPNLVVPPADSLDFAASRAART